MEIKSSNIKSVDHDGNDLTVEFHNGKIYQYKDVPEEIYNKMLKCDSAGSFFHSRIKNNFEFSIKEKHKA